MVLTLYWCPPQLGRMAGPAKVQLPILKETQRWTHALLHTQNPIPLAVL